ncbi:hypothetical protein PN462_03960 [Spirulina sp. CS-785/01]|uniref:hypothetical protein n=1 Tax=Spirulina sp. CS-785/01 TaxID=3021716 RepID=UPI00232D5C96|nr:hypothetical protein [Spirulina sp. CS-785/01]MDB9312247.1 hypothetical protein [Spirulina sp. CS-785/01]
MNLPLNAITDLLEGQYGGVLPRTDLNLPTATTSFPFRPQQRQGLELALSNSPIAAIAGLPGSGKTEIALAALETAIAQHRSSLVITPSPSRLHRYTQAPLSLPPLTLSDSSTPNAEPRERVKTWLQQQLTPASLTFLPLHQFRDAIFEDQRVQGKRHYWLNLLQSEDQNSLLAAIEAEFPELSPPRQQLLSFKLRQNQPLLAQRERLSEAYATLSDHAITTLADTTLNTAKIPHLCLPQQLSRFARRTFDLVIVADSHHLTPHQLKTIAASARKLVLLGEVADPKTPFSQIFNRIFPAYRLELEDNYRLHPELANSLFPLLYERRPYTPLLHTSFSVSPRLIWHHIVSHEQLETTLETLLPQEEETPSLLTFSTALQTRLQTRFPTLDIRTSEEWYGQECQTLWIINQDYQPTWGELCSSLTRARERIGIFGDSQQGRQSVFAPLWNKQVFSEMREIVLEEEKP